MTFMIKIWIINFLKSHLGPGGTCQKLIAEYIVKVRLGTFISSIEHSVLRCHIYWNSFKFRHTGKLFFFPQS